MLNARAPDLRGKYAITTSPNPPPNSITDWSLRQKRPRESIRAHRLSLALRTSNARRARGTEHRVQVRTLYASLRDFLGLHWTTLETSTRSLKDVPLSNGAV